MGAAILTDISVKGDQDHSAADMLTAFTEGTEDVKYSIIISADGLLVASAGITERAYADRMAGVVSALGSVARGGGQTLSTGGFRQLLVDMEQGHLIVCSLSDGCDLGVLAMADCDLGLIGYEVASLVRDFEGVLTADVTAELKAMLPD